MKWTCPLPLDLVPTRDSESFRHMAANVTGLPLAPHPGAFGVTRKHHVHEGVDLYAPDDTPVRAVEDGLVVNVIKFTGPSADPPTPWWNDTEAVLIWGQSGVVLYGEVSPVLNQGDLVRAGSLIGLVSQVLTKDKGRPMSMLHLELHQAGTMDAYEWPVDGPKPASLLDPTPLLLTCIEDKVL